MNARIKKIATTVFLCVTIFVASLIVTHLLLCELTCSKNYNNTVLFIQQTVYFLLSVLQHFQKICWTLKGLMDQFNL